MAQPDDPARTARPRYLEEPSYCAMNTVRGMAQLWVRGYDEQIVCAVCADGRAGSPAVSVLGDVVPRP